MFRKPSRHHNSQAVCPTCLAEPGERCVTKNNRPFSAECDAHVARVHRAAQARNQKLVEEVKRQKERDAFAANNKGNPDYAFSNPSTAGFVTDLKKLCEHHGVLIAFGMGTVLSLDMTHKLHNFRTLEDLSVLEKSNGC